MRNIPKPLNDTERYVQDGALAVLRPLMGTETVVNLKYRKRSGDTSECTGKVSFFSGEPGMDTGSVTIDTVDRGPRTINLHRISAHRTVKV